ncbi:hypothetical protein E2C01_060880 [Portunus trituberculatus]|uniref:Uncharacterized protein n=1 Tax=Portunus trituberculatus TaxID=210409 RepID=A0A5B7HCV6_PORTR|nr:hypothetical protein [Portunus trituberculatus]
MVWKDLLEPLSMFAKVSEEKAKNINIFICKCTSVSRRVVAVVEVSGCVAAVRRDKAC